MHIRVWYKWNDFVHRSALDSKNKRGDKKHIWHFTDRYLNDKNFWATSMTAPKWNKCRLCNRITKVAFIDLLTPAQKASKTNHRGRGKTGRHFPDDIFKSFFSNEQFVFWLKIHWGFFLRVQLTVFQHWFMNSDNGLATTGRQAIIWTNDGYWRKYASLGLTSAVIFAFQTHLNQPVYGHLTRFVKIMGCACTGNAGNVFPPLGVSNPDMRYGIANERFALKSVSGKTFPAFPA